MVTNFSANDTLRGREAWGLPICLALVLSIFLGAFWYCKNRSNYNPDSEIRAVQSQNGLEKSVNKYKREK